jgi:DNA-binding IclR family transcriptional regulator
VSSRNWTGVRTPGHCTSDGKVLLAFGAIPFPTASLERLTTGTITDPDALSQELATVRHRGFGIARSELEDGLHGLAVPVLDGDTCVAALCVSGPEYRLRGAFEEVLAPKCLAAAAALEHDLGYGEPAAQAGAA